MNFIYAFSGLQGVSRELYESAAIEGAGSFCVLWHITLPCISPTLFFLLITNTIGAFQAFAQVNLMTAGGPGRATFVLAYSI
jgi:sn-glycerol 3-phosphate transport system permease protein